jgi:hypothetical protein
MSHRAGPRAAPILAALRRRSGAIWLALLYGAVLAVAIPYVLGISNYVVMPDELGYMKQAVHFGDAWRPSVRGDMWFNSYAQLGPLLFAPGYALWSTPVAFDVAHVISAAVFASTVFPVYLLARSVMEDRVAAGLAAALAVAVPWVSMTASLLTEPIAYPAFAWSILAMTRAIERRTPGADAVALGAIAVAMLARTQLVVLGAAFVAAAAIVALRPPLRSAELRAALRGHRLLLGVALLGALVLIDAPSTVLGAYAGPLKGDLVPPDMFPEAREMLAYLAIGTGVVSLPLSVAYIGLTLWRPASPTAAAFAAVALSVGVVLTLAVGSFNARFAAGINDRYLCFLAPILVVAAMALLVERRPAVLPLCVGAALTTALFATAELSQAGPSLVAPIQTFMPVLNGRSYELGAAVGIDSLGAATTLAVAVAVACVLLAFARRRLPARPLGLAVGVALLAVVVAQTLYDLRRVEETQAGVSQEFLDSRGWLDRVEPRDEPIGLLLGPVGDVPTTAAVWWDTSFWSARADRVWAVPGTPGYEQGFRRGAEIDERTGRMAALDQRRLIALSAGERRFGLRAAAPVGGFGGVKVVRVRPPVYAAWTLETGTLSGFVASGDDARLRIFSDGVPGHRDVSVVVAASPQAPGTYRARMTGAGRPRPVRPDAPTTLTANVTLPAAGHRDLVIAASSAGGASPAGPGAGISVQDVQIAAPAS